MTEITAAIIKAIAPNERLGAAQLASAMMVACGEWEIDTPTRQAAFLAQTAQESDGFKTAEEYTAGDAYEGRKDLGNTEPGDGRRFKGRALIMITGRANYAEVGQAIGLDLVKQPTLLLELENAVLASAWWWWKHGCNQLADDASEDGFKKLSRRINGGLTGWVDRLTYWERAKRALA